LITSLNVINTIARGGAAGTDLLADSNYLPVQATITVTGSNYANQRLLGSHSTIVDAAGNQSAAPVFANPQAGDYREAAASPTIDHGLDVPLNGAFDIDGDVRRIGTTDIGADEFVFAPVPTTLPASDVTEHSVTLNGSVDPRGVISTYHFEYGTSTAYRSSTPETMAGSSIKTTPASSAPSDLTAGTTYHYRLVATNSGGVSLGTDQTFRTAGTAPAPPDPAPPAPAPSAPDVVAVPSTPPAPAAFGGVRLTSTKLTYARGTIRLTLRCPAGTVGGCSGKTRLSARRHGIGQVTFSIAPGRQGTVKLGVTRAGRRLLSSTRRVSGKAVNAAHDGAGQASSTAANVTIRRLA
jgi:hypothetical protein